MTPAVFVETLRAKGGDVLVSGDGARVRLRAPQRVLTPKVTRYVERHKPELLALLREREGEREGEREREQEQEPRPSGLVCPFDGAEQSPPTGAADVAACPTPAPLHGSRSTPAVSRLIAQAQGGHLSTPPDYDGADLNADVRELWGDFQKAHAAGNEHVAEECAGRLLDLAEWLHAVEQAGERLPMPFVPAPAAVANHAQSADACTLATTPTTNSPRVVFAADPCEFWQRHDAENGTGYARYAKAPA